jgi:hypothetical protein
MQTISFAADLPITELCTDASTAGFNETSGGRDIVDAMRTCDQTRQAIVKLNMAYVYRLRRAGFLERLGLIYLLELLNKLR